MTRPAGTSGSPPPGLLGLYALSMMERDGRVHGYGIAERIADRTEGSWRPGAGAIYPSLRKLELRGWALGRSLGRRRVYQITPEGRRFLGRIRQRQASVGTSRLDLSVLWAEVAGSTDLDSFLMMKLRRALDAVERRSESPDRPRRGELDFREEAGRELSRVLARLRFRANGRPPRTGSRRGKRP